MSRTNMLPPLAIRHTARTPMLAALVVVLLACVLPVTHVAAQQGDEQLTINQIDGRGWPQIALNITLTGPDGKAIPNVNLQQFEIREENQPQALTGLALGPAKDVPLALVLAFDVSGSMTGEKLAQAKAAAISFLAPLRPIDSAAIVAFNTAVHVVVPSTNDRAALEVGINSLQAGGNTAAYDALYQCAQLLTGSSPEARRAIVLLTDGADNSSRYGAGAATDVARQAGAFVYTIGLGPDAIDSVLESLSVPTGGKYYKAPNPSDLQGIYAAISVELSSQLLLKYQSTTRVARPYQLISVQVKYTSASGQVVVKTIRYRPPISALLPTTPEVAVAPTPFSQVPVPPGVTAPQPTSSPMPPARQAALIPEPVVLFGSIFAALAVILLTAALALKLSPSLVTQRLTHYTGGAALPLEQQERQDTFFSRAIVPLMSWVGRRIARLTPTSYTSHIQQLLTLMGPPYRMTLAGFLGLQFALMIVFGVVFVWWALRTAPNTPMQWLLAALLSLVMGLYFPYYWLVRRVRLRKARLLKALPGALDFLAINVEAGLGFDAAMAEVAKRWHNALTDELALLLIDFQIGKPRREAWRDLIDRTQVPELTSFVTAVLQNEQTGASIASLLRTQAEQMRVRRRQRAEEAARVAPVKMLLPLVFFIFPGILVVLLGPAIPQFLDAFGAITR